MARAQPVRMIDVASRAGVSLGTVSNFFNRPEKVSPWRRQQIEAAVTELGFVPNGLARAFAQGRQRVVGLLVLDLNNGFFSVVARGMEDRLAEDRMMLTVSSTDEDPQREQRYLDLLEQHAVSGMVVTSSAGSVEALEHIRSRGTPVVLLARRAPERQNWCAVTGDDSVGSDLVARHLTGLGHRDIVYVNGAGMTRLLDARREGLRTSVEASGARFREVLAPAMTIAGGEEATAQLLPLTDRPTAVACANDLIALGVLRTCAAAGVAVPNEISVVGYDDVEFAASLAVPLTTVSQDKYALGYRAADLLLAEILEGTDHVHTEAVLAPELVVRASTAGPRPQ